MKLLENNIMNSVKFSVLLSLFTYFILMWNPSNDLCNEGINSEIHYQNEGLFNKCNNRLLAKHETQKDLKYPHSRNKLSDDVNNMNLKYEMNNISTYDHLNKKKLNDLESYKKRYKNRYSKKKGLAKLDCYCEKKIFNKIDEIYELSRSMQNDKKNFKKKIYNKFRYHLILFALSQISVVILAILFNENGVFSDWCTNDCTGTVANGHDHGDSGKFYKSQFNKAEWDSIFYINTVFFFTLCITALIVIIYTLVKVVKYERLKAGKGKMNIKEYCRFCKDIL
ncbi:hypothetical protein PVNG_06135 [Plasmodium vivax North Korean]|uniref:Uncharacterized protein n=1 Tax=Plasmodium vivax North Korean TaxID=1035514 RepID=A0A0J9TYT8_PLAVI|nr:hypothetical protein PVNG_06135 [Plasmodium vivax North Korean]